MITDIERLDRIGELLRLRSLIMAAHEEQLERIDGRLRDLYPAAFLELLATAQAQGQSPPDFLEWWAKRGSGAIADFQTAS